jgi:hypothetical protein
MLTRIASDARVVGGLLDPVYDRSYYSLVPCPRLGVEVDLADHRCCQNFGGLHIDPETGAHLLYCHFQPE